MKRGNKPVFCAEYVVAKAKKAIAANSKTPIRIYSRSSVILPMFVGLVFEVHNGKSFKKIVVTEFMIGYRFGALVETRSFKAHGGDKKNRN